MGTRVRRKPPRAHWALLTLSLLVLLALLSLNGYATNAGAEGTGAHEPVAHDDPGRDITGRAAVQRLNADGTISSRGMPARTIALTFDDGPDPTWTPRILAVLARYHAHATFFQVGSRVNRYPQISRDVVAAGHEIGSHTFTHAELATVAPWRQTLELTLTSNAIAAATGHRPTLLRPPYSSTPAALTTADDSAARRAETAGYLLVLADRDTEDWQRPGTAAIARAAQPRPGAGAIVLMHDAGGDRAQTVAALDTLIPRLQAEGYRFVTVSEGLRLPPPPAAPSAQGHRGQTLRAAQLTAAGLTHVITALMLVALVLAALRLLVQLICASIHQHRTRRRDRQGLHYLGPVSVVVPAYNEAANIAATVRSLVANDYPWIEVIVVDDGSTDGTADIVERLHLPNVHVLRQANAGKPTALNTGIEYALGDLLVLVDGDTVFEPGAIGLLVQPLRDAHVGAVSGNTKVANRRGLLGRWQHLEYVIGFNLDRRMFDIARCMPTVPGAIGAFRRAALQQIGGVPADTLAEDTDLTMAVIRAGWQIVYQPTAIAWTEAPATIRQLWRQRYRWCYGTMQAMWKHRRALTERGPAGHLGRRGVSYLILFQVLLPLAAPMVDVYALYGLLFLPITKVAAFWAGFTAIQVATAAYALHLDHERYGPLWTLPLQQIVYRQLMYLVVIQSTIMALTGGPMRWHRMTRIGAATAHHPAPPLAGPPPADPSPAGPLSDDGGEPGGEGGPIPPAMPLSPPWPVPPAHELPPPGFRPSEPPRPAASRAPADGQRAFTRSGSAPNPTGPRWPINRG